MTTREGRSRPSVTMIVHEVGPVGGMERHAWELITGLLGRGWSVTVIAYDCSLPAHPGLNFVRIRGPRRPFPVSYPWFMVASWLAVRLRGTGLVHTHGAISTARSDVSTVHFCHQAVRASGITRRPDRGGAAYAVSSWIASRMKILAERWVYRRGGVRSLVVISRGVETEARRWLLKPGRHVRRIPHGVDHAAFRADQDARARKRGALGIGEDECVAVFLGGEWDRKGLGPTIDAVGAIEGWRLLVVGRGEAAPYVDRAEAVGADVTFLGPRTDVPDLFAASDAFVLPTQYETFCLAAHEAASSGLPLLCGRTHGIDELLVDGVGGWFVSSDGVDIAERLSLLRRDPDLRERMGAAARDASRHYTWPATVARHERLYRELLDQPVEAVG